MVGRPRRDPVTGDLVNHPLHSTDVTAARPVTTSNYETQQGYEFLRQDPNEYRQFLSEQRQARIVEENVNENRKYCIDDFFPFLSLFHI